MEQGAEICSPGGESLLEPDKRCEVQQKDMLTAILHQANLFVLNLVSGSGSRESVKERDLYPHSTLLIVTFTVLGLCPVQSDTVTSVFPFLVNNVFKRDLQNQQIFSGFLMPSWLEGQTRLKLQ